MSILIFSAQMYILNIETSTKNCSVSLAKNGEIINLKEIAEQSYTHSEKLHVFIDELLEQSGVKYNQLAAIGLSKGPGSYTGLRIGTSTAKGFCFALDIPLIAIDSLTILAHQIKHHDGLIIPMIDARRMEVYTTTFDKNHHQLSAIEALVIEDNSFETIREKTYFVGDGATKCKEILNKENFIFLDDIIYPSAKEMGELTFEKFKQKAFEDLAYFVPFYLKEFFTGK